MILVLKPERGLIFGVFPQGCSPQMGRGTTICDCLETRTEGGEGLSFVLET